jgi:tetratricopeptide (TPR) repeat protein
MDRALAKDPKKRFASGTELVEAIRSLPEQELPETPESRENEREALDAIRGVEDSVADTLMKEARRTTKIEPHPLTPADIFSISSLSEEETARTLLGLLRSGIVELESGATGRDAARKAEAPKSQPSAGSPKLGAKERQEIELMFVRFQEQDDWQVLDIAPGADLQTIKRAFQKKTLRYHPDRYHHVDDPALHKKVSFIFTRVSEAFANLSNRAEESRSAESTRRPIPPAASPAAETPGDDDPGKRAKQLFQRAKRAYDKTDYWEAIQFCREAIELANDQAEYFHLLGLALARNPSWRKEAEENLRIASSLDPLNAEYFLILGEIYQREGLDLRARKMFEQAKKIDPDCKIPGKD